MNNDKNEDLISLEGLEAYIVARRDEENTEIRIDGTGPDVLHTLAAIIDDFATILARGGIPDEWISLKLTQTAEAAIKAGLKRAKENDDE